MEVAYMKVGRNSPRLITASELQRQYGARVPKGIRFTCANCGQRVKPCAMSAGGIQSPHFRHEQNNEIAQQCDLYASGVGGYSGWDYQRVPMPMFIHKSSKSYDHFVVEGGFKSVSQSVLATLEKTRAQLMMGAKRYDVNSRRFGSGLTRIPFEDISLTPVRNIRLVNSTMRFEDIWNPPEDANKAMVFTCEPDTLQGKRLRSGECVSEGSDLLLLAPKREGDAIGRAFRASRRIGFAGSIMGPAKLQVYHVKLSLRGEHFDEESAYLSACGVLIGEPCVEPELLWPPSLTGDGSIRPLLTSSSCIFGVRNGRPGGVVFVSEDPSSIRLALPSVLTSTNGSLYTCLIMEPSNTARLVLSMPDSSRGSLLLDASSSSVIDSLEHNDETINVVCDGTTTRFEVSSPVSVFWLRKGHAWDRHELTVEITEQKRTIAPGDLVRVVKRLKNSSWFLTVWEHAPEQRIEADSQGINMNGAIQETREGLLELLLPENKRFAKARCLGTVRSSGVSQGKEFALKRSVST